MSSATLPPWLSPWSTGLVYGQRVYQAGPHGARPRERSHRPHLTIYTYGHGNDEPVLRFSSWSAGSKWTEGNKGSPSPGGPAAEVPGGTGLWERVPLSKERPPWGIGVEVPEPLSPHALDGPPPYDVTIHSDAEYSAPAPGTVEALAAWSSVLRGWAAGAALLALLVLLVRAGERYLDWKIQLRRRRLHREWQRANVRATSLVESALHMSDLPAGGVGLPPPYSACSVPGEAPPSSLHPPGPKDEAQGDEPPPPYSDCVQFINKNGIPILVYNRDPNDSADPDVEGQQRVDRLLQACGVAPAPAGNALTYLCDDNFGTMYVPPEERAGDEVTINVNDDLDPLSDDDDDVADAGPDDVNYDPNDSDSDTDIVPIHIDVDALGADYDPKDGSVLA